MLFGLDFRIFSQRESDKSFAVLQIYTTVRKLYGLHVHFVSIKSSPLYVYIMECKHNLVYTYCFTQTWYLVNKTDFRGLVK